jgi:hypothetical protein
MPRIPRHRYAMALLAEVRALRVELDAADRLARTAMERTQYFNLEEFPSANQLHIALAMAPLAHGEVHTAEEHFERAAALPGVPAIASSWRTRWFGWRPCARATVITARLREAVGAARELLPELGRTAMPKLVEKLSIEWPPAARVAYGHRRGRCPQRSRAPDPAPQPSDLTIGRQATASTSRSTPVRTHARRVLRKLGACSRAGAIALARAQGLL